jgi:hypothetical protein
MGVKVRDVRRMAVNGDEPPVSRTLSPLSESEHAERNTYCHKRPACRQLLSFIPRVAVVLLPQVPIQCL